MLSIFSVPKNFEGQFGVIQRNAIISWTKISPKPEIILFGVDKGTKEICEEFGLKHIPQIKRNEYNTPLLNDIFQKAKNVSKFDTFVFVSADVILLDIPLQTVRQIKKIFDKFLLIGQRYELKLSDLINFHNKKWKEELINNCLKKSKLKGPTWIDYFIFPEDLYERIPSFAVGRTFWDKWLVWYALNNKNPVIDCTDSIIAAHQSHDYSHAFNKEIGVWEGKEAQNNIKLAGGWSHGANLKDATYIYKSGKIISNPNIKTLYIIYKKLINIILYLFNCDNQILLTIRRKKNIKSI